MPLILNIDTATQNAAISLAQNEQILHSAVNTIQKDHASFLQPAIKRMLQDVNISINQLDAVSVTAGPGSYTGLRVGMASAKGICYALQIPLIAVNTLNVMALSVIQTTPDQVLNLYCPMLDAGRMEVFTALFDDQLNAIVPPSALILQPQSFEDFIQSRQIIFSGNGAQKFIKLSAHENLRYADTVSLVPALARLSLQNFQLGIFADLLNAEPVYLKPFYTLAPN